MRINSSIFEAYLKCPMKCWLRSIGEPSCGNTYAEWVKTQNDFYRATELKRRFARLRSDETAFSPDIGNARTAKWRIASNVAVKVPTDFGGLESELHAVELAPSKFDGGPVEFIPIRLVSGNKIGNDEKLLVAFDAFVLSESLGLETRVGKIIHGDDSISAVVRIATFTGAIRKRVDSIRALLSGLNPPDVVLNRHCPECEFRNGCRRKAKEADDLSLPSGMSQKQRARHRSTGIFTTTQLSYTFKPRRTPKRASNLTKPHNFALQALSIREKCIYIHGSPVLPECKTHVYLDIEGLPDRDFHYLIGAWVVTEGHETFHSFWADRKSDETTIFIQFAEAISELHDYRVFHFGNYDAAVLRRIAARLPKDIQERFETIIRNCFNVLSLVHSYVYFPTYANSLKKIISCLRGDFDYEGPAGLDSVVWRTQWENTRDLGIKTRLIEYNQADCTALQQLTDFITWRISKGLGTVEDGISVSRTDDMKQVRPHWQLFAVKPYAIPELEHVSKSAYFDYQREKVFIRTYPQFKSINNKAAATKRTFSPKPNKLVLIEAERCADCRSRKLKRDNESSHVEVDLKFSQSGIKRVVTRFVSWRYWCEKCGRRFRSENRLPNPQRFGHGLASWCVYQNNVLGVNMSKVRKSFVDVFGLRLDQSMLDRTKERISRFYQPLYVDILNGILTSSVLHIDETPVKLRDVRGYVWVLTTLDRVYYFYRETRETEFLGELLAPFRGVLVSDFFTGYDFLPCAHQKCIVHFVRDIDDDLLRNPLDEELKNLTQAFGILLRSIVSTIDRFGLRCRHLKKHKRDVDRFMETVVTKEVTSELAKKYARRFTKYGDRMFTFLNYDGVPWNNINAEHAIKRFVKHRHTTDGETTLKEYLIIASVMETCEFNYVNGLTFLLTKERSFEGILRMAGRKPIRSTPIRALDGMTIRKLDDTTESIVAGAAAPGTVL